MCARIATRKSNLSLTVTAETTIAAAVAIMMTNSNKNLEAVYKKYTAFLGDRKKCFGTLKPNTVGGLVRAQQNGVVI